METTNEHLIKITGSAFLNESIDPSKGIVITRAEVECYSVEKKDNFDGTADIIYKTKFTSTIEIEQNGKKISGKDKSTKSRQMRKSIYVQLSTNDGFYENTMDLFMRHLPEIYDYAIKLDNNI